MCVLFSEAQEIFNTRNYNTETNKKIFKDNDLLNFFLATLSELIGFSDFLTGYTYQNC